jgi:hypothetical protein
VTHEALRIASPAPLRVLAAAFVTTLVVLEAVLVFLASHIARLAVPAAAADPRVREALALLAVVMLAQALGVLVTCLAIWRTAWTTIEAGPAGLVLGYPGRRWPVPWERVTHAYLGGVRILHLEVDGRYWRTWRVSLARDAVAPVLAALEDWLPAGAWTEGPALRRYVLRKAVPLIASLAVVGALAIRFVDTRLREMAARVPCGAGQTAPGGDPPAPARIQAAFLATEGDAQ